MPKPVSLDKHSRLLYSRPLAEHPLSHTSRATYACSSVTRSLPKSRELREVKGTTNSGIVSTDPVDKAGQFRHMARFCSLEPGVQCLHLVFFEQGDKFLAQEVDRAQVLVKGHLLNLSLLHFGEF